MSTGLDTKFIPDVCFEYWSTVDFMMKNPFLYGMDSIRSDVHGRLCQHYEISTKRSRKVTDNMERYSTAYDFHAALVKLQKEII